MPMRALPGRSSTSLTTICCCPQVITMSCNFRLLRISTVLPFRKNATQQIVCGRLAAAPPVSFSPDHALSCVWCVGVLKSLPCQATPRHVTYANSARLVRLATRTGGCVPPVAAAASVGRPPAWPAGPETQTSPPVQPHRRKRRTQSQTGNRGSRILPTPHVSESLLTPDLKRNYHTKRHRNQARNHRLHVTPPPPSERRVGPVAAAPAPETGRSRR